MKSNAFMVLATGAVVASAFSAFGVNVATTADNNSYDLAAPATCSGGVLPAASDTVRLASGQATYTCSEDITFGMIYFSGSGQTIDLSATPGRTITLGGSSGIYPYGNNRSLALVGGKYFFSNKGTLQVTVSSNPNTRVSLSGGVVVTNVGTVKIRNVATDSTGPTLSLAGSGTVLDAFSIDDDYSGPISYSYTGDPMETGVGIDVSGGARIRTHASGPYGSCFSPSGVMIVRGEGAGIEATTRGYAYIGNKQPGTIVHITDGGSFTSEIDLFISEGAARGDNHLRVDNGGTANLKSVNISGRNDKPNGTNNWLEVVSGGSVTVGSDVSLCGTNQHVVVSNGTLSVAGNLKIGNFISDRGHEVRISGASSSLVNNKGYFFYSGSGHRFTLDDGAVLSRGDIYFTNGATDAADGRHADTLEVLGGASLTMGRLYFRDYGAARAASNGNTLRVASYGSVSCTSITLRCADNTVSISNGTVVCTESFSAGGNETSNNGTVYPSSGDRVILEGETPRLACSGTGTFNDGVTILFHPSASGFTTTAPVLTFANIVSDGTAVLSFEGIRQLQKTLRETKTYTLAEATGAKGSVGFTDAQIAAANETLPEKCHIGKSPDGKRLLLKVSVELPTRFIVK